MEVYVVYVDTFNGVEILGIFKSEYTANQYAKLKQQDYGDTHFTQVKKMEVQ